jgi:hypothetical protein
MLRIMYPIISVLFIIVSFLSRFHHTSSTSFSEFKIRHGKTYSSEVEHRMREKIFEANVRKCAEHNKKFSNKSSMHKMVINKFSDLETHEVLSMYTGFKKNFRHHHNEKISSTTKRPLINNNRTTIKNVVGKLLNFTTAGKIPNSFGKLCDIEKNNSIKKIKNFNNFFL